MKVVLVRAVVANDVLVFIFGCVASSAQRACHAVRKSSHQCVTQLEQIADL